MMVFLESYICDQQRSYRVGFSTEEQAEKFISDRRHTHVIREIETEPIPATWGKLLDALYPLCEHQMSLQFCHGPGHFMSDEQERAMDWQYAD